MPATARYLDNARSPQRKVHELDNRGSTFYLTLYWAQAMAEQVESPALAERFRQVAAGLTHNEARILEELNAAQGEPQDLGGYYMTDGERTSAAMRPSATLNGILSEV